MARRWPSRPIIRWLSGLLASVAMVAALTAGVVALLEPHVPVLTLVVLYLLVVLLVAVLWETWLAAVTSVFSVAAFDFFFLPPTGSIGVAAPGGALSALSHLFHPHVRPSANIQVGRIRSDGHMAHRSGGEPPCAAA